MRAEKQKEKARAYSISISSDLFVRLAVCHFPLFLHLGEVGFWRFFKGLHTTLTTEVDLAPFVLGENVALRLLRAIATFAALSSFDRTGHAGGNGI